MQLTFVALLVAGVSSVSAKPLSTSHVVLRQQSVPFSSPAPLLQSLHNNTIDHAYIVVLKHGLPSTELLAHVDFVHAAHAQDSFMGSDGGVNHVYDSHVLQGYSGTFSPETLDAIRRRPEVEYVERDQVVHTMDVQRTAPWGLARISHRKRLSLGTFSRYEYATNGGEGVNVYVIDTGINIHHREFEGRAKWGKTVPQNDVDEDGNGHGTHCAGTIASKAYGVAKGATVIAVKVLGSNGSGSMSDVVSGVVWAADDAAKKAAAARAEFAKTGSTTHRGSVANMSLGGGKARSLDDAVNRSVEGGLHFAVAAGNDNRDACDYSPAGAELAVTVGASTIQDERASFSNHGPCVDVFAPGLNIRSTWIGSDYATNTISGTSMASPHTAGLLAYLLSIYPHATFNPYVTGQLAPEPFSPWKPSIFSTLSSFLPSWLSPFLPISLPIVAMETVERGMHVAPIPKTLTPAQLKKALLDLSTQGVLSELPPKTVNLLVFNNATRT